MIAGRYRLTGVIGRGGMATIHRAIDARTGRDVAIKLLRPEISTDREFAERFRREALAATVLRHPNIVACLDTGTDPAGPYMVMELIEGEDLAARIRRDGALTPRDVARMGLDVARGLSAAHTRGIVHRDVKPGNIMLARDGRSMITDFGIARLAADAEAVLPGTTLGSVQYFSPEQAQGRATSAATDIYGLGLVMFEALTARRPWSGATTAELAAVRVGAPAPSPRVLRPNTPLALDAVVVRALDPDPAARYENGGALAAALEPVVGQIDRTGTTRTNVPAAGLDPSRGGTLDAERGASRRPWSRGRRAPTTAATPQTAPGASRRPYRSDGGLRRSLVVFAIIGLVIAGTVAAFAPPGRDPIARASDPPTDEPTLTDDSSAAPTATDDPVRTAAPVELCRPFLDLACGIDPGRYTPSGFGLPLAFTVGDGWTVARHEGSIVSLTRGEGTLTFAIDVGLVDPSQDDPDGGPRAFIRGVAATSDATATAPATVRIDGRRGASTDLSPADGARPAILVAGDLVIHAEPGRTTRVVALDVDGVNLVIVIGPAAGTTLRDLLETADDVAASLRFE